MEAQAHSRFARFSYRKVGQVLGLIRGKRPHVRGSAMNPYSHPLGGGEGRSGAGRPPCSPWGKLAKGGKTRKRKKASNRLILRKRTK